MLKRLLIVDDEPDTLKTVAVLLRGEGYDVLTARNSMDALVHVARAVPDLVISDIRMPGMSGYELARALREAPRTSLVPIIFLTGKDQTEDRIEGYRAGVDAFIEKPFDHAELLALVRNLLNRVERTHAQIARLVGATNDGESDHVSAIPDEKMTEAEWRVALAVSRGLSNKDIAAEFKISVRTVENHISHILAKKNFSNRVEIARFVLERSPSV